MSDHERNRRSWEKHRLNQLTAGLDATPAQRIAWLEEMMLLAFRSGALPRVPESDGEPAPAAKPHT